MEPFQSLVSTVFGKALIGVIVVLSLALLALGLHDISVTGERNVLSERVNTKNALIASKDKDVSFMKAWVARDKLDAQAKEEEYNRTMAEKPKFITSIKYVPTGNNCADLNAIAEEARRNAEGERL